MTDNEVRILRLEDPMIKKLQELETLIQKTCSKYTLCLHDIKTFNEKLGECYKKIELLESHIAVLRYNIEELT